MFKILNSILFFLKKIYKRIDREISNVKFSVLNYKSSCRRSDPNLEECLINAFEKVKYEFATGNWFPQINITPMDPLNLQK